ncbi:MAG: phenylacetate-CoA oxygenase subunit PaaJ [Firmicutes bacterium]|nr:phenylacetate-CoA oxygenase subunit PaaJ [Bacillota bacterium]
MSTDVDARTIWESVEGVEDPELPITIGGLGIVEEIKQQNGEVEVHLVPTFVGCPALNVIEKQVKERVAEIPGVRSVSVHWDFSTKWSRDRISDSAARGLREYGVERPQSDEICCPYCKSTRVHIESSYGPSLCRSVYFCDDCHNPFETIKVSSPRREVLN